MEKHQISKSGQSIDDHAIKSLHQHKPSTSLFAPVLQSSCGGARQQAWNGYLSNNAPSTPKKFQNCH
ncbi:hypothetical protein PIB30_028425 [Stylosanthes scabra]|uniref:Uncharacterized protein n=1 Tax=Stylosanthes scabra TaxID=79078 RepID=A0ABU6W9J0_9FABA|nr:hypothetical protein [Stylosanthes scabra]